MDDDCEIIEKHIKDLLSINCPSNQNNTDFIPFQGNSAFQIPNPLIGNSITFGKAQHVSDVEASKAKLGQNAIGENALLASELSHGLDETEYTKRSELIDHNVLANFAAKYLDDTSAYSAGKKNDVLGYPKPKHASFDRNHLFSVTNNLETINNSSLENSSKNELPAQGFLQNHYVSPFLTKNAQNQFDNANPLVTNHFPSSQNNESTVYDPKVISKTNVNKPSLETTQKLDNEKFRKEKKSKKLRKEQKKKTKENETPSSNTLGQESAFNNILANIFSLREKINPSDLEETDALKNPAFNTADNQPIPPGISTNETAIKLKRSVISSHLKEYELQIKRDMWHFMCDMCNYNTSDQASVRRHIGSPSHLKRKERKEANMFLNCLPEPLPAQIESITEFIKEQALEYGLSEEDVNRRKVIVERIDEIVKKQMPDCSVELVGSSISGFGMKASDVDMVLKVPTEKNAADMLASTYQSLLADESYKDVYSEFRKKIPRIQFVDIEFSLTCNISIDNGNSSQLTKLLSMYSSIDPRVLILAITFRNWAQLCEIDQQETGTLPSFCFPLLLIYFLQQQKPPVLPVVHEMPGYTDSNDFKLEDWRSENNDPIGLLWIKLLRFYSLEYKGGDEVICIRSLKKVTCDDKNWGTKIIAIEDPFILRNLAHVIPTRQVYQYILDCFLNTYRYFAYPQMVGGPIKLAVRDAECSSDVKILENNNDESSTPLGKTELSDETESSENTTEVFDLSDHFEDHDSDIPLEDVIATISKLTFDDIKETVDEENEIPETLPDLSRHIFGPPNENAGLEFPIPPLTFGVQKDLYNDDGSFIAKITSDGHNKKLPDAVDDAKEAKLEYYWEVGPDEITKDMMTYTFQEKIIKNQCVPRVCRICQKTGHLKKECPDEKLPLVLSLPKMTPEFLKILDRVCLEIRDQHRPTPGDLQCREEFRLQLQSFIREIIPGATLQLFGSFCNGFGFTNSDMDFCLTFRDDVDGKMLDHAEIIGTLAHKLRKNLMLANVIPIVSAKVPIVKFVHKLSGLEGDISLYNTLAQFNTKMLEAYCKIDERVQILGYVLKYFAKVLGICDASRGSLSSYAYVLMVIFFLQQRKPPVIPVLQELHEDEKPRVMVDGWNAWFFSDVDRLPEVWPDYGQNNESVGELWLALLSFYVHDFDVSEYVVSIKQKEPITHFKKLWNSNSKKIAIEDPFDLSHNLGSGLSSRMNNYILKAFIRGRQHFGTPVTVEKMLHIAPSGAVGYLFDRRVLNDGREPPNDRGCRICGKIGHVAKDCPRRNKEPRGPRQRNQKMDMIHDGHSNGSDNRAQFNDRRNRNRPSPRKVPGRNQQNSQEGLMGRGPDHAYDSHRRHHQFQLSMQRFPNPGFTANSQQGQGGHPTPFTIQPHQAPPRPVTTSPFPMNVKSNDILLAPSRNSLNAQQTMPIGQQWTSDHRMGNYPRDNGRYFPQGSQQSRRIVELEQHRQRGGHATNRGSSSHYGAQHMSNRTRSNSDTSGYFSEFTKKW